MIRAFQQCPFLYAEKYINGNVEELEHDYFLYGSAVDCLLTEKERFDSRFLPVDRRVDTTSLPEIQKELSELDKEICAKQLEKKPCKGLQDKKEKLSEAIKKMESAEGKDQITLSLYQNVLDSVSELERQELYRMFNVKDMAQEIITLDAAGDMPARKGKLDYINVKKKIIADIKTTANITTFRPRDYCQQLAYYRNLASIKYGVPENEWNCYLLVVDKSDKFKRSEIYFISNDLLDIAKQEYEAAIIEIQRCKESGFFSPCTENNQEARREKCFNCDHYSKCPFSIQKEITVVR